MTSSEFKIIPISVIYESKTNPRRHFAEQPLKELAANVAKQGVLEPILVRHKPVPLANLSYEIIAGARRYRAAKIAKLTDVPVRICEMTDKQALEVQVIENLQREDVHELDEALGYKALMAKAGHTVETLSAAVNKSASYIYQRLKLAELTTELQKLFYDGQLTAGHAILLARLTPADQKNLAREATTMSVRALSDYIQRHVHLDLSKAPFPLDSTEILATAKACIQCSKRTGANPQLFPDVSHKDSCTDRACYQAKSTAFVQIEKQRLTAETGLKVVEVSHYWTDEKNVLRSGSWTPAGSKKCDHLAKGYVHGGEHGGKFIDVCLGKGCKVHGGSHSYQPSPAELKRRAEERQKQQIATATRRRLIEAVLQAVPASLRRQELEMIAETTFLRLWHDSQQEICTMLGFAPTELRQHGRTEKNYRAPVVTAIPKWTDQELARFIMLMSIAGHVGTGVQDAAIQAAAKAYGVPADRIAAQVKEDVEAKNRKLQTSAKRNVKVARA